MHAEHKFESREAASVAAAARIAGHINAKLAREDGAMFAVSGGTTPVQCFEFLSGYALDWDKVRVALTDERWVPRNHDDSNEGLVRKSLLQNEAESGSVLPVFQDKLTADDRCDELQSCKPRGGLACSLVGMGADGHFASLFPDTDSLEAGLNTDSDRFYIPVHTVASPHPRVSMTLGALLQSSEILLLFFGTEKLAVYEKAKAGDASYPATALLGQQTTPVSLYWAP